MNVDPSRGDAPVPSPTISGRWFILAVAAIALSMAAFAWFYWYSLGHRAQHHWGPEISFLIARAPHAEALLLDGTMSGATEVVLVGRQSIAVVARRDLMRPAAPGWSNLRSALLRDSAYQWNPPAKACTPKWQYALHFSSGDYREAVILVSIDCPRLALADGLRMRFADGSIEMRRFSPRAKEPDQSISVEPIAERLGAFLRDQFAPEAKP